MRAWFNLHGRVNTNGAEECACVLDVWVVGSDQLHGNVSVVARAWTALYVFEDAYHDKASDSDRNNDHVENTSLASTISEPTNNDGHSRGDSVRRNRQKLRVGTGIAHTSQDGGQEQRERVQGHQASHVDDGVAPALPVLESSSDVATIVLLSGVGLVVGGETTTNADAVLRGKEASGAGPIEDHPPAESADEHGSDTLLPGLEDARSEDDELTGVFYLDDENPSPAILATDAIHQRDRCGEQTTERTGQSCGREEDGSAETKLGALVPARQVVVYTYKNVSFEASSYSSESVIPGKRPASARPRRNLQAKRAA